MVLSIDDNDLINIIYDSSLLNPRLFQAMKEKKVTELCLIGHTFDMLESSMALKGFTHGQQLALNDMRI